jgi:acetolactate synthase I/II/III large subunit
VSSPRPLTADSAAGVIARMLKARGVDRVFGLCGGHIMPLWMRLDAEGIGIVDVRDERAAVYMAHAYGQLKATFGVALVTAGPGVTNAMTGIANAHVARAPVLVLSGVPPRAQENRGALQDILHTDLVRGITRYARTVREAALVPQELDQAIARAQGLGGDPGPVYLDFPTDTLRDTVPAALQWPLWFLPQPPARLAAATDFAAAVELLWNARRPLVITGRGAAGARDALIALLDATQAACLDTGESRGVVPSDHPSLVNAMRGQVMSDCDLVVTVGRRLDFQLAYGSPAVFGEAKFLRLADAPGDLRDNRPGDVELLGDIDATVRAIVDHGQGRTPATDPAWIERLRSGHRKRSSDLQASMRTAPDGRDGRMHPNRLLAAIADRLPADAVVVADGGDFLAFARTGVSASTWLDPGSLGCIGIGTPFGVAAALACPGRVVAVLTGDGAFGFNAMEVDTAVRHRAPVLIVVANNGAWQIEVHDQATTHGKVVGTRLQDADHAALARAFGMHAERVEQAAQLDAALDRALQVVRHGAPALVDVRVTTDAVSADAKSGLAWVPDLQPLAAWDASERRFREGSRA